MKKLTILILFFLCFSFNITMISPLAAGNIYKEGFYKISDLNIQPNKVYDIQNVSGTSDVYILVFDKNQNLYQSIRMPANSPKYKLLSLEPDYRIIIVGNGEVFIS